MTGSLLRIANARKVFGHGASAFTAVKDMSLDFPAEGARLITLAGESGCGKSTLALMALGFLEPTSGEVSYKGVPLSRMDATQFRAFRRNVQAVFQNPFETFNPFYKVSHALKWTLRLMDLSARSAEGKARINDALQRVKLDPARVLGRFPHELSGGQLQRVSIARAILLSPELIVADEPVSMIDASLRVLVLRHLVELKTQLGINVLYITHDLSTALQISDELLIACKGEIVERGRPEEVVGNPRHEYTKLLVSAVPVPDPEDRWSDDLVEKSSLATTL